MLAVLVSTSVHRVQFQRVRSIQSTQNSALTAVLAQVFVLQRLSTRVNNAEQQEFIRGYGTYPLFKYPDKEDSMKALIHIIVKSIILTAIGVACYFIYTGLMS